MNFFDKLVREGKRIGDQMMGGGIIPSTLDRNKKRAEREAQRQFEQQQAALNQQQNLGQLEVENAASSPMVEIGGTARRQRRQRRRGSGSVSNSLGL